MSDLPFIMKVSITGFTKPSQHVISITQYPHKVVQKLKVGFCFLAVCDEGKTEEISFQSTWIYEVFTDTKETLNFESLLIRD
jgi:hypothetical protein